MNGYVADVCIPFISMFIAAVEDTSSDIHLMCVYLRVDTRRERTIFV